MTSKEALSDLSFLAIGDENHTIKCKETIEKDLEVLEKENKELKRLNKNLRNSNIHKDTYARKLKERISKLEKGVLEHDN